MFGFGRKQNPLLGIDIGSTAVKLVELSRPSSPANARYQLERYAIEPLSPNAMAEKKIADVEAVGQGIARALRRSETKLKRAAVAISGSAVITKNIALASTLSEADMEAQLQLEADQYIPFPLEEVNMDFDVLGPSESDPKTVEVLLAASRRENIDDRIAALSLAGLTAEVVDVEAYAMERACHLMLGEEPHGSSEQTIAIADIGATSTTLHVLHKGDVVYTREQKMGGLELINKIQQRFELTREEATAKIITGDLPDSCETEILTPFSEALAQQIGRALQFFYSATQYNRVDRILLAGATASLSGLERLVEERLSVSTAIGDPLSGMSLSKDLLKGAVHRDGPALMVAVGLALRGFS